MRDVYKRQQYASTGDERFKQRVDYIVHELDSCQQYFVNGFIGGMPGGDRVFKQVKKGIIRSAGFDLNGLWVPWYNEHKTMMGLNDAYLLAGNKTAKKVLVNLADYLVDVLAGLTDEQVQTMLNCEFGGMNEAFAQVYACLLYTSTIRNNNKTGIPSLIPVLPIMMLMNSKIEPSSKIF